MMMAGGSIWIVLVVILLLAVLFVMVRLMPRAEKRKIAEKPKRSEAAVRSHLVLGDDGELVEIIDDDDTELKHKRDDS